MAKTITDSRTREELRVIARQLKFLSEDMKGVVEAMDLDDIVSLPCPYATTYTDAYAKVRRFVDAVRDEIRNLPASAGTEPELATIHDNGTEPTVKPDVTAKRGRKR